MDGEDNLVREPALRRGEGMLLGLDYGAGVGHLVAVYRCRDGHYIF